MEAQLSPMFAIKTGDFDKDGDQDIIMGGNLYGAKPEVGRYDASYGVYLENDGQGNFTAIKDGRGFRVDGEVRDIIVNGEEIIISRNSETLVKFKIQ